MVSIVGGTSGEGQVGQGSVIQGPVIQDSVIHGPPGAPPANDAPPGDERAASERELALLRREHRDLDAAINALERSGLPDQVQVQRLKKRKLTLRDRIGHLEDELTPDLTA